LNGPLSGKRVYIDTNIFAYLALAHPDYYAKCREVLEALVSGDFEGYGSYLVLFELFGALSKYSFDAAYEAAVAYLELPIEMVEPSSETLDFAREIARQARVTYDALHAALAAVAGVQVVVTEDTRDWSRIERVWDRIVERYGVGGLRIFSPTRGYL
jgi:predicted nucleic acid-binding protein